MIKLKINNTNTTNIFNKSLSFKKDKNENILISGMYSNYNVFCFINEIIEQKSADNFIYININGDLDLYNKYKPFFSNYKFNNKILDLNNTNNTYSINRDNLFLFYPDLNYTNIANIEPIYRFLLDLPLNTGKDIPIVIDAFKFLNKEQMSRLEEVIYSVNKKGYYFIIDFQKLKYVIHKDRDIASKLFTHSIIFKQEEDVEYDFLNSDKINELKHNEFFYYYKLKIQNETPYKIKNLIKK